MPDWGTFAVFAGVVLVGLLLLARASQSTVRESVDGQQQRQGRGPASGVDEAEPTDRVVDRTGTAGDRSPEVGPDGFVYPLADESPAQRGLAGLSPAALLVNVALSHGLFAALLLAGAWYTGVPAAAVGVTAATLGVREVLLGTGFGLALYVANEIGATVGRQYGLGGSEALREALAPETGRGWVLLLGGVLPLIAGFEELLFRGVLIGAFGVALGVSPWLLAVVSSALFALGHGAQGATGIVVTGVLGFVLAAGFVLTGSLLLVVVAHYVVNALEFVVHELVGVSWTGRG